MKQSYNKNKQTKVFKVLVLSVFLVFSSIFESPLLGQVKKYSKIEKKIRKSYNLEETTNIRKRQKRDRSIYKVYSDSSDNLVYLDAYSQKNGEPQDFLTPYYVLDNKNDFLKVVKATPKLIGKPKGMFSFLFSGKNTFKDAKKAKYVGWIHKDRVLYYSHPKLSEYNYKPLRYVIGSHKVSSLYNKAKHVHKDSVYIFKDPFFKEKSSHKLMLDQFVYLYKYSVNKKAALVSNLAHLNSKTDFPRTMGWIPESLLKKIGQQQVYSIVDTDSLTFFDENKKKHEYIDRNEIGGSFMYDTSKHQKQTIVKDSLRALIVPINVWNHSDNKLINVDGEDVLIRKLKEIKNDNKKLNFHFIFDCSTELQKKQLLLMSSLQRIGLFLSTEEKYKGYEVSFSASSYGCGKFYRLPKTTSFLIWVDFLQNIFLDLPVDFTPEINTDGISQCFEYATQGLGKESFTNNIIIISGEKRFFKAPQLKEMTQRLGKTSSRIIFYQLESKSDDYHQDYILQAKDILGQVSLSHSNFIRAFIVENTLIKNKNTFKSIPAPDNIYIYDAPDNSTYQGGITFPKINKVLSATSFDITLDSVLSKTIRFNKILTNSLEYHAENLGFLRSKSGDKIKEMILKDTIYFNNLSKLPRNYMFERYYQNKYQNLEDNPKVVLGYLLSKEELKQLVDSYKSLVPLFSKNIIVKRKHRRRLYRLYRKNRLDFNKNLFRKTLRRKDYLADLFFLKTGLPVKNIFLTKTKFKHMKRKRKATHIVFAETMRKLRDKIEILEELQLNKEVKMYKDGSGKEYYFISNNQIL
ncbi:hypothetical protein G1K72_10445 [Tenacibaculum finnmarkense]|uniref:type VI secretion system protein TssR domain-containing protein n=1 Tax=Tenacibaculum finnmarkense TaxID=2781243 RepID=UPI00187B808D|nr:type VI secretion system protein TssR domain-containing protein [Tenacibaculum finnmarkense]MBE7661031.1 hypothetical protein [Tenacibaculum finnmarkense genomovar finnmarkense]MCD8455119.1 hypothetical protein [Tenacibaculum finnmarkense genomovar ulcerans]MCG8821213.1 hypothetical protein [Tenacibaculum finnmarkense]